MSNEENIENKKENKVEEEENLFDKAVSNDELKTTTPENVEDNVEDTEETDGNKVIETKGFSEAEKGEYKKEYDKIGLNEEFPKEGRILTIEKAYPQEIRVKDIPSKSTHGLYYKKKFMVCFEESRTVTNEDGDDEVVKFREPVPSVFYGIKDGVIAAPRIPKACAKEDLDGKYTSVAEKMRYQYHLAFPDVDLKQSDAAYVKDLIGKKVLVKKIADKYKKEGAFVKFALLTIVKFVTE